MIKHKDIVKLMEKGRERKKTGLYIAEGKKSVMEAVKLNMVEKVFVSESFAADDKAGIMEDIAESTVYEVLDDKSFNELSGTVTPQGILAAVRMFDRTAADIIGTDRTGSIRLLILENIQDPGNLGTMIRTAEAAGYDGVLMNKGCVDIYNPKVVRSTMGSIFRVPFAYCESTGDIIDICKENNIRVYGAALGGTDIREEEFPDSLAFIIGNEANGLSQETLDMCDSLVKIPMGGSVESLNASVAAGLLMYMSNLKYL